MSQLLHISHSSTNRENSMACQGGHGKELRIRVSKGKLLCPEDMVSIMVAILYNFLFFDKQSVQSVTPAEHVHHSHPALCVGVAHPESHLRMP